MSYSQYHNLETRAEIPRDVHFAVGGVTSDGLTAMTIRVSSDISVEDALNRINLTIQALHDAYLDLCQEVKA